MLTRLGGTIQRRFRLREDAGITLIELIVTMTITSILGAVAVTFFVTTERFGYGTIVTNQAVADARTTLDNWTSALRVADWLDRSAQSDRFEEITPTKIVFYADLDNRGTADQTVAAPTKIALLLRTSNPATGEGQLVEIRFGPDNTTPASVQQFAFDATPSAGQPIFQPWNTVGGAVDTANTLGCWSNHTARAGLCLQSPPSGAGMLDPRIADTSSLAVTSGSLRGNPNLNVDPALASIAGVTISFTCTDSAHDISEDFTAAAAVNSGGAS